VVCGTQIRLQYAGIAEGYSAPKSFRAAKWGGEPRRCTTVLHRKRSKLPCERSPLYWEGLPVDMSTKVRKIDTPFSYRKTAVEIFDQLFARFSKSIIVLSYSSNGFPDLEQLETLIRRYKKSVRVFEKQHRYHFGTHENVEQPRFQNILSWVSDAAHHAISQRHLVKP